MWNNRKSHSLLAKMQSGVATWKAVSGGFLQNIFVQYDPAIMLLNIYPSELKLMFPQNTWRKHNCILLNGRSQSENSIQYAVWFLLYDLLEKVKLQRQLKCHWLPRVRGEARMNRKSKEDFLGQWNCHVRDCNGGCVIIYSWNSKNVQHPKVNPSVN